MRIPPQSSQRDFQAAPCPPPGSGGSAGAWQEEGAAAVHGQTPEHQSVLANNVLSSRACLVIEVTIAVRVRVSCLVIEVTIAVKIEFVHDLFHVRIRERFVLAMQQGPKLSNHSLRADIDTLYKLKQDHYG